MFVPSIYKKNFTLNILVTVRNEVAKVMFLHLSVCPRGGVPGQVPPPDQVHPPGTRYTPQDQVHPRDQVHPPGPGTPQGRSTWTVRILLECIPVLWCVAL